MQFTVVINQTRALEWGLNAQQAMLFAFLYSIPSWAEPFDMAGRVFYRISRQKIVNELPLLTDKTDTVYRLQKQLAEKGLIQLVVENGTAMVRITEKGAAWNRSSEPSFGAGSPVDNRNSGGDLLKNPPESYPQGSEKNPSGGLFFGLASEKNPSYLGKKSELTSEKNPTNQYTNKSIYQDHEREIIGLDSARESYPQKSYPQRNGFQGEAALAVPMSPGWVLPIEWQADALRIDKNLFWLIDDVADKFRDHWLSVGAAKADWRAAWRNWVRREVDMLGPRLQGMAAMAQVRASGSDSDFVALPAPLGDVVGALAVDKINNSGGGSCCG